MFRISIRDVLWLTMVGAVSTTAWINWSHQREQNLSLNSEVSSLKSILASERKRQHFVVEIDTKQYLLSPNQRVEVSRGQEREVSVRPLPPRREPANASVLPP